MVNIAGLYPNLLPFNPRIEGAKKKLQKILLSYHHSKLDAYFIRVRIKNLKKKGLSVQNKKYSFFSLPFTLILRIYKYVPYL